ncbi:MAG TPA: arginine--tRNA ligase [Candidatus Aphodocola excrementigallinarum]|uniref:Arginine--tRNA ligase n=1 Tax=Candidatus Aphodocola excrementigallinarum TaxID=2840670 RepID=A0A9D1LJ39_9FIRM|nr:arginine--tRNA ligase [Candidatus Aphodocola excrementigallinarum]
MNLKDEVKSIIYDALNVLKISFDKENLMVEVPKKRENGDFSSNVAMRLAKTLKDNPVNIANKIKDAIDYSDKIEKIEIANPGFINIYLKDEYVFSGISNVINDGDNYGKCNVGKGKKIDIEFVSANPTGILHLGTARGAAYGSNLANIMSFAGYNVTKEYYINDAGNQINNLGISIKERYKGLCGKEENMPEDGYYGNEIIDIAKMIYDENKNTKLNEDLEYFKEIGVSYLLNIIKNDLSSFGVCFDVWTSEKAIRAKGRIEESLKILKEKGLTYENDGALWLKTTVYGDDKDRVLIKKDKSYTYLVPDIAYHLDKFDRGFDYLIDVFGADHHSYVSRLKASIEALGYDKDKLEVRLLQMVRLLKDGRVVKMSKRTGGNITISELVDEVGCDCARYFFAERSLDGQMDFDISLALKKSNENPFYYVGYAHARICSILSEAKNKGLKIKTDVNNITDMDSKALMLKVYEFMEVVKTSALKKEPHLITNYVYELASLFHNYYGKHRILTDDVSKSEQYLGLIKTVEITIKNALKLIGVTAPDKM